MIALIGLKTFLQDKLPNMTADKCHLFIVNGTQAKGYMDYTVRLLFLDYRSDPIEVIMLIRSWLKSQHLHLDTTGNDVDFPQRDKIVMDEDSYHICPELVWSDSKGGFIPKGSE